MTAQPTLNLNFAQARFPDPRITFTRASTGTYIDALGRVQTEAVNQPRFEWDPVTGQCMGLLAEGSRTNLLTYSEQLNNAAWEKTRSTITADATTAPTGAASADKLVEDATASATHQTQQTVSGLTVGAKVVVSVYAKAAERPGIEVGQSGIATSASFVKFDLATGAGTVVAGSVDDYGATKLGGGWFRLWVVVTAANASGFVVFRISNGSTATYTGDGTSGIYVWGAQLEVGPFPSTYIKTEDAAATRATDVASIPTNVFPFNPNEGTLFVEADTPKPSTVNATVLSLEDGTTGNRIQIVRNFGAGGPGGVVAVSGGQVQLSATARMPWTANDSARAAVSYQSGMLRVVWLGQVAHEVTGYVLPTVNTLRLGSGITQGALNGHIRLLVYFPRALDAATLMRLTA